MKVWSLKKILKKGQVVMTRVPAGAGKNIRSAV